MWLNTYLTRVENKFVFNLSRLVWHILVTVAVLAILGGIAFLAWSLIPPERITVVKPVAPPKESYPPEVEISLAELERASPPAAVTHKPPVPKVYNVTDPLDASSSEYDAKIKELRDLVPLTLNIWEGEGHWTYPEGERYWQFYKDEKYRKWVRTKEGVNDHINDAMSRIQANTGANKARVVAGYIQILKNVPDDVRERLLLLLVEHTNGNVDFMAENLQALAVLQGEMLATPVFDYFGACLKFSLKHGWDGIAVHRLAGSTVGRFNDKDRFGVVTQLARAFEGVFDRDPDTLSKVVTQYIQLMDGIDPEHRVRNMVRYFDVYVRKNDDRAATIKAIDDAYKSKLAELDSRHRAEIAEAELAYSKERAKKAAAKHSGGAAVAGGITAVVLVAILLVFLSIQRSVRAIEVGFSNKRLHSTEQI